MNDLRLLVAGAGAVGGFFGGRLAQAGRNVTFLVRGARARQLRDRGLEIVSPLGDATIPVQTVTVDDLTGPYDLILLGVKTYALPQAIDHVKSAVGENTVILPVLNGMRHMDVLVSSFGPARVFGGVCIVSTTLDERGRIVQLNDLQQLVYGELDGSDSERLRAIDRTLRDAGFAARISPDIIQEMWEKWVFIAALGASTCLMHASTGEILALPRGRGLILMILDECAAVATSAGHALRPEALERIRGNLTNGAASLTSSMYRDLQNGAPVEADAILGDMCARGEAEGLNLPLLNAAFAQLSIYEAKPKGAAVTIPDHRQAVGSGI